MITERELQTAFDFFARELESAQLLQAQKPTKIRLVHETHSSMPYRIEDEREQPLFNMHFRTREEAWRALQFAKEVLFDLRMQPHNYGGLHASNTAREREGVNA